MNPIRVVDDEGIFAGIVTPGRGSQWSCSECLTDGVGGPKALLDHVTLKHGKVVEP